MGSVSSKAAAASAPPPIRRLLLDPSGSGDGEDSDQSGKSINFVGPDKQLDWRGPVVGFYSVVAEDGELYDLNDHYSKPRNFCGILVRSPIESFINLAAFATLLALTIAATTKHDTPQHIDWLTTIPKLVHLFFHSAIHIFPNFSPEHGLAHRKCIRVICGIVFGLARYVVMFVYAWRIGYVFFGVQIFVFAIMLRARFVGELVKTATCYIAVSAIMCLQPGCSGMCWLVLLGTVLQLIGSGCFYLVGQCVGHYYKHWRRDDDRVLLPYHVVSDVGNALWMVATSYDPKAATPLAFDVGISVNSSFPQCWW